MSLRRPHRVLREVLQHAVARGEISAERDLELIPDVLMGLNSLRILLGEVPDRELCPQGIRDHHLSTGDSGVQVLTNWLGRHGVLCSTREVPQRFAKRSDQRLSRFLPPAPCPYQGQSIDFCALLVGLPLLGGELFSAQAEARAAARGVASQANVNALVGVSA